MVWSLCSCIILRGKKIKFLLIRHTKNQEVFTRPSKEVYWLILYRHEINEGEWSIFLVSKKVKHVRILCVLIGISSNRDKTIAFTLVTERQTISINSEKEQLSPSSKTPEFALCLLSQCHRFTDTIKLDRWGKQRKLVLPQLSKALS